MHRQIFDKAFAVQNVWKLNNLNHWKTLMRRSQRGCQKSYRQMLNEFSDWIPLIASERCGSDHQMDEIVTETLLAVHHKIGSCDANRPILPWLVALANYKGNQIN